MTQTRDPNEDSHLRAIAADVRWATRCLSVVAAGAIGVLLYALRPVLAPFVVALFLAVGLRPVLDLLQSVLGSRLASVTAALLLGIGLLSGLWGAVDWSIEQLAQNSDYEESLKDASARLAGFAESWGILPNIEDDPSEPPDAAGDNRDARVDRLLVAVQKGVDATKQWLLSGMVSLSGSISVVLIYMFFLLMGASTPSDADSELWRMIEGKLREYLVLKTVISIGTGVAVWAVLAAFGVPLAVLLGLLTFLLNYIPNFGPLVTCVLPLPLIWLSPETELSLVAKATASVLACGIQIVGGNVVEPRMMGSSFDLHPIVVLLALMAWYAIWGFVGMLLAVPITAAIKVSLERIDRTRPIARLMAGDLSQLRLNAIESA